MKTYLLTTLLVSALIIGGCKKETENQVEDNQSTQTPVRQEVVAATVTAQELTGTDPGPGNAKLGDKAWPLGEVKWIKNGPVKMVTGQVYVLEFWATWCGPCLAGIPHLTEIQHEFKDRGVTVIGLTANDSKDLEKFVADKGDTMDYSIALAPAAKVFETSYVKAFGVNGIPHALIIDREGIVAWRGHPMSGMDEVLAKVVDGNFDAEK